jgi:predicted Fe-Mo cluster-binding NifX family protein
MTKVLIPIEKNQMSEHFETCTHFGIYDIKNKKVSKNVIALPDDKSQKEFLSWVYDEGITDIILYKIDNDNLKLYNSLKVNLFIGIKCTSPDDIIQDFIEGILCSDGKLISEIRNSK